MRYTLLLAGLILAFRLFLKKSCLRSFPGTEKANL